MNKKKVILGSGLLIVLIVAMTLIWTNFREKPVNEGKGNDSKVEDVVDQEQDDESEHVEEGSMQITIEVINSKQESTVYELKTDVSYLREAMEEAEELGLTFEGEEGAYGMMVMKVNGETADYNVNQSYWSFYVNDELCNYGIDTQPVEDGDAFKIVYTK